MKRQVMIGLEKKIYQLKIGLMKNQIEFIESPTNGVIRGLKVKR